MLAVGPSIWLASSKRRIDDSCPRFFFLKTPRCLLTTFSGTCPGKPRSSRLRRGSDRLIRSSSHRIPPRETSIRLAWEDCPPFPSPILGFRHSRPTGSHPSAGTEPPFHSIKEAIFFFFFPPHFLGASNKVAGTPPSALAQYASIQDDPLIREAIRLLEETHLQTAGTKLSGPDGARDYLRLKLAGEALEVFAVLFLDHEASVHLLRPMFHAPSTRQRVSPSGSQNEAIEHNCSLRSSSPTTTPRVRPAGHADKEITSRLNRCMRSRTVDVRVLDTIFIGV